MSKINWGILGSGKICQDFSTCLKLNGSTITAVGARSKDSAQKLASSLGTDVRAHGSYKECVDDADVTICYVGVIHPHHFELTKLALEAGKHVVCEKPMTMSASQTEELVALARSKKLFLMEGYWTRFFPACRELDAMVERGELGDLELIQGSFCVKFSPNADRLFKRELGGGGHLDIGIYLQQWVSLLLRRQKLVKLLLHSELSDDAERVDINYCTTQIYEKGCRVQLSVSCTYQSSCYLTVVGSKKTVHIPSFMWCPTSFQVITALGSRSVDDKQFEPLENLNFSNSHGFKYEIQEVERCLQNGLLESERVPLDESIELAKLNDRLLKEMNYGKI